MSHDLRAPLRHIEGFVEILRATKAPLLDDEARKYLETITDSAKQMGKLIDDLLSFSRTARVELRKVKVSLNEIVQSVLYDLRQETTQRQTELEGQREQFMRERLVLEDQHRLITTRQQAIQREMAGRVRDRG